MNTDKLTRITADEADTLGQDWRGTEEFSDFLDHIYSPGALHYLWSGDTHFAIRIVDYWNDKFYAFHIDRNADHYIDACATSDLDEDTLAFYKFGEK